MRFPKGYRTQADKAAEYVTGRFGDHLRPRVLCLTGAGARRSVTSLSRREPDHHHAWYSWFNSDEGWFLYLVVTHDLPKVVNCQRCLEGWGHVYHECPILEAAEADAKKVDPDCVVRDSRRSESLARLSLAKYQREEPDVRHAIHAFGGGVVPVWLVVTTT